MSSEEKYAEAIRYIRDKIDQMLELMGTLPLRQEELDDETIITLDPIGIIVQSFAQVLEHLNETNHRLDLIHSELRTVLDSVEAAIVVITPEQRIEDCNLLALQLFFSDCPFEQVQGKTLEELRVCGGEVEGDLFSRAEQSGEFHHAGRDFTVKASPVMNEAGEIEKTVLLYADVSAQKRAIEELKIYGKVFDNTAEGILVTDARTQIVNSNRAFGEITGYTQQELQGEMPSLFKSGMHDESFYKEVWESLESKGVWRGEIFDRRKDGTLIPLWQTISSVRDEQGVISNYISIINDISPLKETQLRLDHLAHHDPLTDLPNRLLLQDRLAHAIKRGIRDDSATAVLFIDLDRFKTINDSLGHYIGDRLLQQVAKRLTVLVRQSDSIARLGGDEFVILLEEISGNEDAARLARKVIEVLREPFNIDQHELHIGCSIGISISPDDGEDALTVLKNADTAMYRVKETGRDGYHIYSTELSELAEEKLRIESALRKVIQEKKFYLQFQPIVDAQTDRVTCSEALLRWNFPGMEDMSPANFIPVAEESNLIIPIGQQVLDMAIAQLVRWREQGIELEYLSVNVSGPQLYHSDFASNLIAQLQDNGIEGRSFQVEITENVLMENMERCVEQLNELREYGIRIAIDDFGMGYSSLSYLRRLPLDLIKVDRSFVSDISSDKSDSVIAHAIVNLAQSLELESVAEGIETDEQREYMRSIGCNRFQGYYYSRPLSPDDFARYWQSYKG
ncbi:MAG: EAL domain-containing protein [Pseudomonadota bacterium]